MSELFEKRDYKQVKELFRNLGWNLDPTFPVYDASGQMLGFAKEIIKRNPDREPKSGPIALEFAEDYEKKALEFSVEDLK